MNIKFRQGWTNFNFKLGDIQFFRISWDIGCYWFDIEITILNFSIQIDIG